MTYYEKINAIIGLLGDAKREYEQAADLLASGKQPGLLSESSLTLTQRTKLQARMTAIETKIDALVAALGL